MASGTSARFLKDALKEGIDFPERHGATDTFIARQIGRRYLMLGFLGGAGGAFAAWVAAKLLAVVTDDAGGFLPAFSIDTRKPSGC